MDYLNNPRDSLTDSSSWSDVVDVVQPSVCHLCVPSCGRSKSCGGHCCGSSLSIGNVAVGHAFDMIMVQSDTDPTLIDCSDAIFSFTPLLGTPNCYFDLKSSHIYLELEDLNLRFPIDDGKLQMPHELDNDGQGEATYQNMRMDRSEVESGGQGHGDKTLPRHDGARKHDRAALMKLAQCWSHNKQNLSGRAARIVVRSTANRSDNGDGRVLAVAPFNFHFWSSSDRIFVCDIDGTITKSNIRGLIDTIGTLQYKFCHDGVCRCLQSILSEHQERRKQNLGRSFPAVRFLYLTSRPLGLAFSTRRFLRKLRQPDNGFASNGGDPTVGLPPGPLLGFTGGLWRILAMELVTHSVHEFKTKTLQNIAVLWQGVQTHNNSGVKGGEQPFLAGLGNTFMDAQAYHEAGMNLNQIYIINKKSEIRCLDRPQIIDDMSVRTRKPRKPDDYKQAQRTTFPAGYQDKHLVGHILSDDKSSVQHFLEIV